MGVIDFPARNPETIGGDRLPPQNLEAEQAVLGAILIDPSALNKAMDVVKENDFYRESHRKIYSAIIDLNEQSESVDLITLTDILKRKDQLESVGGAAFLSTLVNVIPTAANIRQHARIIHEKAILRKLISIATEIVGRGYEAEREVEELLDQAEASIFSVREQSTKPSFVSVKDMIKDSFETIERLYEKKEAVTGVPTGFKKLDEMTSGFQASDLIVIAGRPSMGKTALALGMAQHLGIDRRGKVAIFSLEMSKEQLVMRMLCSEARVDSHKLRTGYLGRTDWPKLTTAAGRLTEAPIFIDDTGALTVLEMRAKARRLKAEHGLDLIIVDYLQLMRGRGDNRNNNREQEISDISRSLKALAKELDVPVIALSQLSRAVENRTDKRPVLADLRESGAIEQDADIVIFIYRDEVYHHDEDSNKGIAEVILGKQRNGPIGTVKLAFLSQHTRFETLEPYQEEVTEEF
ncbi:MAG TPA: replicative DNA helicase [Nitrospiria bacterium]